MLYLSSTNYLVLHLSFLKTFKGDSKLTMGHLYIFVKNMEKIADLGNISVSWDEHSTVNWAILTISLFY